MSDVRFFGEYTFDRSLVILMRGIEIIDIPQRQLETLYVLLAAGGAIVSREMLLDQVWKDVAVEEHNLTQSVFLLRKNLGRLPTGEEYIETIPRRWYRISAAALLSRAPVKRKNGTSDTTLHPLLELPTNDIPSDRLVQPDLDRPTRLKRVQPPLWLILALILAVLIIIVGEIKR